MAFDLRPPSGARQTVSTTLIFPGAPSRAGDDRTDPAGETLDALDPLDTALHLAWRGLDRAHPTWALPREVFTRSVRQRLAAMKLHGEAAAAKVPTLALDDLYLVIAGLHGASQALDAFFSNYDAHLVGCFRRSGAPPWLLDDLLQDLRASLFSPRPGGGSIPRLALYTGRGSLKGWLRTTIGRMVTDAWRRRDPAAVSESEPEISAPGDAPDALAEAHQLARRLAPLVQTALDALSPEERNLLLKHLRDCMHLREIGEELGVVPSTVQRRIKALTARLGASVLQAARERLGVDADAVRTTLEMLATLVRLDDLLVPTLWLLGSLKGRR